MWGVWIDREVEGEGPSSGWAQTNGSGMVFATPSRGHAEAQAAAWRETAVDDEPMILRRYSVRTFDP